MTNDDAAVPLLAESLAPVPVDGASPQCVAEAVRDRMLATDRATRACGIEVIEIGPGAATLRMTVRADMLNGFDTCHGGFLTVLADSAFAFACNTANTQAVAASIAMEFLAPAREGEVLTARATEVVTAGRSGHYDVRMHDQRGVCVAVFRGRSHRFIGRPVVEAASLGEAGHAAEPSEPR